LRRDLICSAALSFRPDIVLVDHMPHGARGELLPALDALRSTPAKLVLGLRDILDAPKAVRSRWRTEGAYAALDHYDLVLVYGSRTVFDVAKQYAWSRSAADLLVYCGYVCRPMTTRRARRIRSRYLASATERDIGTGGNGSGHSSGDPNARLIVATAGGGADAYPLMDALLSGFPRLRALQPCAMVIITGPFMPVAERRDLQARVQGLPIQVRTSVKDIPSYIAAADVVVGMAGYNTTAEILSIGTPAVLVPRGAPSAEQRMRARLFAERGWVGVVDPDDLGPDTLVDAVHDALAAKPPLGLGPDLHGLEVAVGQILALIDWEAVDPDGRPALLEV
jgi:predicted glycosyltransferase